MLPTIAPVLSGDQATRHPRWSAERAKELLTHRRPLPVLTPGWAYADNPNTWLRDVRTHILEIGGRADRVRGLLIVAELIARGWHPVTRISTPGHDVIAERVGCHDRTVTRLMRVMEARKYLLCTGRGDILEGPGGQVTFLRAEYSLLIPAQVQQEPIPQKCSSVRSLWDLSTVPRTKSERHAAGEAMQYRIASSGSGWLRGVSAAAVASASRVFFDAAWTPADVLYALDHRPTEGRWTLNAEPRSVIGWMRSRLSYWIGADGEMRMSVSQRAKADRELVKARAALRDREQAARAAECVSADDLSPAARGALTSARRTLAAARSRSVRAAGERLSTGLNVGPSRSLWERSEIPTRASDRAGSTASQERPAEAGRESFRKMREQLRFKRLERAKPSATRRQAVGSDA